MSATQTRVEGTTTVDRPSHPGVDSGRPPDGVGAGRSRVLVRLTLPVAVVGAVVALGWTSDWFREGLARVAPHMSTLLWAAVAAILGSSLIRRVVRRPPAPHEG